MSRLASVRPNLGTQHVVLQHERRARSQPSSNAVMATQGLSGRRTEQSALHLCKCMTLVEALWQLIACDDLLDFAGAVVKHVVREWTHCNPFVQECVAPAKAKGQIIASAKGHDCYCRWGLQL